MKKHFFSNDRINTRVTLCIRNFAWKQSALNGPQRAMTCNTAIPISGEKQLYNGTAFGGGSTYTSLIQYPKVSTKHGSKMV